MKTFVCVLLLTALFSSTMLMASQLTIVGAEWAPYNGRYLPEKGLLSELTTKAFETKGYRVSIKILPWKRALINTRQGISDGLMGTSYFSEREQYFLYPKFFWNNEMHFYSHRLNPIHFRGLQELCPAKIGLLRGSFYQKQLEQTGCLTLELVTRVEQNVQKLVRKRLDLIIESKASMDYFLKQNKHYRGSIFLIQPAFDNDKLYTVISKKIPNAQRILEDFDRGIQKIKANGIYQQVLRKHGFQRKN